MVTNTEEDEDSQEDSINYKQQYRSYKRKLKFLIYENECFQESLRHNQRKMLKVTRDRSFLLDRLLSYEKVDVTSSEEDENDTSDDETGRSDPKKRKIDSGTGTASGSHVGMSKPSAPKKKKPPAVKFKPVVQSQLSMPAPSLISDGHLTQEEHLENRQRFIDIEKAQVTIPSEMFSNEPSLDSESNEICEMENSPSNLGEDCLNAELILPD